MLLPVLFSVTPASAQITCGGIVGRVTSVDGWIIPAATIRLRDKSTKLITTTQSNADGEYTICLLAGTYDVFSDSPGYKSIKRKSVKVDSTAKNVIDLVMAHRKESS